MTACRHLDMIEVPPLSRAARADAVCPQCVAMDSGWVHLRQCATCGAIGCCDSSPNRHARAHFRAERHPIIASAEPGEDWRYCFVDDTEV